ncbi:MAG: FtsX-like permease family protein [Odoribacter sp.]
MRHLQRLNAWTSDEVTGVGVELTDVERTAEAEWAIDSVLPLDEDNNFYKVSTLRETAPQVFDWLNLLNANVWIILILILIVAGFNMVSGLLILILDKTSLIGVLKALGHKNRDLRKLFLYIAAGLIVRGMVIGNVLAFVLGGLQYYFRIITLDPVTYYMDTVPINFDWLYVILLNIGVLLVSVLMLIVPTMLISKITPIKAIRFE